MDTNVLGEHTRRLQLQEKAKENPEALLKGSTGEPEKKTDSLQIAYKIPEGLHYPDTNAWITNLVNQYKEILGVTDGVSFEENKSPNTQSTVTITLTDDAFEKMGALQNLAGKQPSGRTP